ncbi:Ldh family oxidoreductase [Streptomyces sp. NPDC016845]|uniref:Ldh family oxidoreductase n=1 Tax=Streptomyces sp. NPDC016845 TaxID=3364972 RepID=UPI00378E7AF3
MDGIFGSRSAVPEVTRPAPACVLVDARDGLAQEAFEAAAETLFTAVRENGMVALWIRRSCGELGHYPRRAAEHGFTAVACANNPARMSPGGSGGPVLGTNPLAYAVPRPDAAPLVIDQASSGTAHVNVRGKAEAAEPIPEGMVVGPDGAPPPTPPPPSPARCSPSAATAAATWPCSSNS